MDGSKNLHKYNDIIERSHPTSNTHPRMTIRNRAAQFAPFAALTGYDDAINETARITKTKIELNEDQKERINEKLLMIQEHIKELVRVEVTYFVKDEKKEGGTYLTVSDYVKKIETYEHVLILQSGERILIEDIIEIQKSPTE